MQHHICSRARTALVSLLFAGLSSTPLFAQDLPQLSSPVVDQTATLNAAQVQSLREQVLAFEQRKGSQIVILIVPTTAPATIEDYAVRVFEKNAIGRKGVDDGVLLLVAKNDRRVRVEVGYGLEGAIPDAIASRIIAEYLTPKFRQQDFHGGIEAALQRVTALIDGEALPPPLTGSETPQGNSPLLAGSVILGFFVGYFAFGGMIFAGWRRRFLVLRAVLVATAAGIAAWALMASLAAAAVAAVAATVVGLFLGRRSGRFASGRHGSGDWSDWISSSSGSSSSSSSWSGGGGSSGGGGASGSW